MAKSGTHFHFKQFSIRHERSTMKVGTDGVLLGAWTNIEHAVHLLDIGAGSGLIALMLAQRTSKEALIDAVEIEDQDAQQAEENVAQSPWPEKIRIHKMAIQDFSSHKQYDVIVSNPPYFSNSHEPPDKRRHQTRHTVLLSFTDLLVSVQRLLKPDGRFNVVLPYTEGLHFITLASNYGLHCSRQWSFRTRAEKPIERWLLEFTTHDTLSETGAVLLYKEKDEWSDSYKALTKDFYLAL